MSKTQRVLQHLKLQGSISSWEAIELFQATRLSDIIYKLKKNGYVFRTEEHRDGSIQWVRYVYEGRQV
jgi:hypothetical protein